MSKTGRPRRLTRRGRVICNLAVILIIIVYYLLAEDFHLTAETAFRYTEKQHHFGPSQIVFQGGFASYARPVRSESPDGAFDGTVVVGRTKDALAAVFTERRWSSLKLLTNIKYSEILDNDGQPLCYMDIYGTHYHEEGENTIEYWADKALAGFVNDAAIQKIEVLTSHDGEERRFESTDFQDGVFFLPYTTGKYRTPLEGDVSEAEEKLNIKNFTIRILCYDEAGEVLFEFDDGLYM